MQFFPIADLVIANLVINSMFRASLFIFTINLSYNFFNKRPSCSFLELCIRLSNMSVVNELCSDRWPNIFSLLPLIVLGRIIFLSLWFNTSELNIISVQQTLIVFFQIRISIASYFLSSIGQVILFIYCSGSL